MSKTINKLQFKNGNSYETISIIAEGSQYIQGQNRPIIDTQFSESVFDDIKSEILIDGNTDTLTIQNCTVADNGTITINSEFVHSNYDIIKSIGINTYVVSAATDTTPEVDEKRTSLVLGQLTYLETTQKSQQSQIDAVVLSSLGV